MRCSGKVFVVTGGGAGIGRAVVLDLLTRGARVAAVDLNPEALQQTVELAQAGSRLSTHVVNIVDREAVDELPSQVIRAMIGNDARLFDLLARIAPKRGIEMIATKMKGLVVERTAKAGV